MVLQGLISYDLLKVPMKGLRGENLKRNVDLLIEATTLSQYGDRLASKLSGGNARKLSLALALIGGVEVSRFC